MGVIPCISCNNLIVKKSEYNLGEGSVIHNFTYKEFISPREYSTEPTGDNKSPKINYKELEIEQIISEDKIHSRNDLEILFCGDLFIEDKIDFNFDLMFCALTRVKLFIYENKAKFISMKKPKKSIPLKLIETINISKIEKEMIFIMKVNDVKNGVSNDVYLNFKAKNEEMVFKWVVVLTYFAQKSTMKDNYYMMA